MPVRTSSVVFLLNVEHRWDEDYFHSTIEAAWGAMEPRVFAQLERVMQQWAIPNGTLPAVFGYNIYEICTFYKRVCKVWIDIAHEFGLVCNLFKRINIKHTWKLLPMNLCRIFWCSDMLSWMYCSCKKKSTDFSFFMFFL